MKKLVIFLLLSFVTLSGYAQMEGGGPGGMPPGGGPGMGPGGKGGPKMDKAPKKEKKKKKVKEEDVVEGKVPGHVYVSGCSFEFGDTIIYFTPVEEVDSIVLTKKTKFLPYCSDFSQQLKDKLESPSMGAKNQTASVFYSDKKAKLEKKMNKMKRKCLKKGELQIVLLTEDKFKFVHPLDYFAVPSE